MQPEQLADRYHDVVFAANQMLTRLPDDGAELPSPVAEALVRLRAALAGPPVPPAELGQAPDPRRDMISIHDWSATPPDGSLPRPYRLTAAGAELAADLLKARERESRMFDAAREGGVTLSSARSLMLMELLRELAARTSPGLEVGPIETDDTFSRAVTDLGQDLRRARHRRG